MPLIKKKSKEALSQNIETEMNAGKPKAQSLAIALNTQRMAKKKKMASGGPVPMAEGGMVDIDDHYGSIADAILKKKRMMAEGGQVEPDSMETPSTVSPYNEDDHEAILKELYDTDQLSDQPEDSNTHGDMLKDDNQNSGSVADKIRRKMKK